ncbi:Abi-alpha family protein [Helicobacter sp. T3_23-1056]
MKNENPMLEIYKDIAQPIARQAGITLNEVGKLIFSPIYYPTKYLNDRIQKWFERIENNVPKQNRIEAKPYITIPTLQNLALHDDETLLGEMFFNILQSSVDKTKQGFLSPAFPKILEQLSQDEAKILTLLTIQNCVEFSYYGWTDKATKIFKEELCEIKNDSLDKEFFLMYRGHLSLLGLISISNAHNEGEAYFKDSNNNLINYKSQEGKNIIDTNQMGNYQTISKLFHLATLSDFGVAFANICISDKCKDFINN